MAKSFYGSPHQQYQHPSGHGYHYPQQGSQHGYQPPPSDTPGQSQYPPPPGSGSQGRRDGQFGGGDGADDSNEVYDQPRVYGDRHQLFRRATSRSATMSHVDSQTTVKDSQQQRPAQDKPCGDENSDSEDSEDSEEDGGDGNEDDDDGDDSSQATRR
ncbi:hypothetical protein ACHAPT_000125 [Fusarium lateritium]